MVWSQPCRGQKNSFMTALVLLRHAAAPVHYLRITGIITLLMPGHPTVHME